MQLSLQTSPRTRCIFFANSIVGLKQSLGCFWMVFVSGIDPEFNSGLFLIEQKLDGYMDGWMDGRMECVIS